MHFRQDDVRQLLMQHYDQIEIIWDREPYDEVNVYALTIKEFMQAHQISDVDQGIERFIAFKAEQSNELSIVGLGADEPQPSPSSRLASQSA